MAWASGCQEEPTPRTESEAPAPGLTDTLTSSAPSADQGLADLLGQLREIEGAFTLSDNATWVLEQHRSLMARFYDFGDPAVRALVDCLDDDSDSKVTLHGKPVPVGVLCGLALQSTAYPTEHEDGDGAWPGVVLPDYTPDQLRRAKEAWTVVLRTGRYRIA